MMSRFKSEFNVMILNLIASYVVDFPSSIPICSSQDLTRITSEPPVKSSSRRQKYQRSTLIPLISPEHAIITGAFIRKELVAIIKQRNIHLANGKASSIQDILSHILCDDDGKFMAETEVSDLIITLLMGGYENTSSICEFVVNYPAESQEVIAISIKVRDFIKSGFIRFDFTDLMYAGLISLGFLVIYRLDDWSIPFGPMEANDRSIVNLERPLDNDGDPLAINTSEVVAANGVPLWNWRDTLGNGGEGQSCYGRIITVKWGEYTRRVGIDGSTKVIKEAIKILLELV
ncbi:hypothetical protein L2E82_41200 [Cichorium intybus]|uniref:Uncharacterized protein n=1 Tax=Cichorium intybus TaxID=13427 RepID=A0ACB9ANG8_CICIN|nr:hypothetical protein L2E82_41200 [Cichorium intybus]